MGIELFEWGLKLWFNEIERDSKGIEFLIVEKRENELFFLRKKR
jgi:hypothetical protein